MNASLPTGLVTFLFTDIEGSTRLWERRPEAMRAALAIHDRLLRQAIESNGGHVVKMTGDGVMAAFGSPAGAVAAAVAAQRALLTTTGHRPPTADTLPPDPLNTDLLIRARMGIHTGAAELREGDYHGPTLNRAARLMATGHGGQVLLSGVTAALLDGSLPHGVTLRPLGEHRLRDLSQPERVFQLVAADLPADFPPLRVASARINLPQPPTGFIGRWQEVDDILALLTAAEARLVSLVGPGGIGKTRLAIQTAATLAEREPDRFADGVFFVPLAHLNAAAGMVAAVAEAIGLRFGQGEREPREQLLDHLRHRRALLILDNMEQLLDDGGAALPADMLAAAPGVRILATSRIRLGIQGEQLYLVPGMSLPEPDAVRAWVDPPAAAEGYSGLRLFAQAAGRVRPDFRLDGDNIATVTRIGHQVQGMPLGIELAAGWLELLTPDEIAAEIERSLDLLATDLRDVPARQRSLRAVFETTWQLASERERALLPSLSVFRAPFAREAATAVAGAGPADLLALVSKSWLQRTVGSDGASRFLMHELLRQYAEEKLRADGRAEAAARERFANHYVALLDATTPDLLGARQKQALAVVAADYPHIRRAWQWLVARGEFDRLVDHLLQPLHRFAQMRGLLREANELVGTALEACRRGDRGQPRAAAALLVARSTLHHGEADPSTLLDEAWMLAQAVADPERTLGVWYAVLLDSRRVHHPEVVTQLQQLAESEDKVLACLAAELVGRALMDAIDQPAMLQQAVAWLRRAGAVYEQQGDEWGYAGVCQLLAVVYSRLGDYTAALASLDCAEATYLSLKDWQNVAGSAIYLRGAIALWQGRPQLCLATMEEALSLIREHGDRVMEAIGLGQLSIETLRYGDPDRARVLREQALARVRELGHRSNEPWNLWELGEVYRVIGQPDKARRYYDEARPLFRAQGHGFGESYCERGLGDLALAAGDFATAIGHFTAARALASEYPDQFWSQLYVTIQLARTLNGCGQPGEALAVLHAALPVATASVVKGLHPGLMTAVAELALAAGRAEAAATLCGLVAAHPMTWNETRATTARLAAQARATLGEAAADAAEARGRTLDAPTLIARLAALPPDLAAWLDVLAE